jgi:adenylate cyclase
MADEGFKRKLAAILSADVEGYSRLMDDDEEATVRLLTSYRAAISDFVKQFRGRIVDTPGDNILADFASVVDAVNCAVEIQQELAERNAELTDNRKMQFRIGVNLGDVIEEDDSIYGDGVNIAARIEGLANAGGICISGSAYEQIENKLPLKYEFMGEHSVKNIQKLIRVYRAQIETELSVKKKKKIEFRSSRSIAFIFSAVLLIGIAAIVTTKYILSPTPLVGPASIDKMAYPLPEKPSIAVLPFDNLSGDPEQEYFTDGMMDSIITNLYKIPDLFVIAKTSSLAYKGKVVKVQQVSRELGVRYVLEGSVQKSDDRVRINVQLIDAVTGNHLWAELYDRELKDVFAVQDEITRKVVTEMGVKLVWGEVIRSLRHATDNYQAADYYLQADKFFNRFEKESNARARELLQKAIELDPEYARATAYLGYCYLLDAMYGWVKDRARSFKMAEELAHRAVTIDDNTYLGHALLASIYVTKRRFDHAIAEAERALEVEPANAMALYGLGARKVEAGNPGEGLVLLRKALRLAPYPPPYFMQWTGHANYLLGRYEAAITEYRKVIARQPQGYLGRISWGWLIASYMELGREKEARAEAKKLIEQNPNFSIKTQITIQKQRFKDQSIFERRIKLLRKAGLPE